MGLEDIFKIAFPSGAVKQHADATKQNFNLTLTHYGLEAVVSAIGLAPRAQPPAQGRPAVFTLVQPHRPTPIADLLGLGPDDIDTAVSAFREICHGAA